MTTYHLTGYTARGRKPIIGGDHQAESPEQASAWLWAICESLDIGVVRVEVELKMED